MRRLTASALAVILGGAMVTVLAGCSTWSDEPTPTGDALSTAPPEASADPSSTPSASATPDATPVQTPVASEGVCAEESIQFALPEGSTIATFQCALGSPYMWAAAEVIEGGEVYFMRSNGPWEIVEVTVACGGGDESAPEELLAMCPA